MSFLSRLSEWLSPARPDPVTLAALARACRLVGPTGVSAEAERHLLPAVRHALGYCEDLVAQLPPPVLLDGASATNDPLLHAMLPTNEHLLEVLGASPALRQLVSVGAGGEGVESDGVESDRLAGEGVEGDGEVHALLVARRRDKHVFGVALEGDTLVHDVAQTLLNFTDHLVVHADRDPQRARARLRDAAVDSLFASFAGHVQSIRSEIGEIEFERGLESTYVTMLRYGARADRVDLHMREIEALNARLREDVAALQPERLMATLAEHLLAPERALSLREVTMHVLRSGVVVDAAPAGDEDVLTLSFRELLSRDRRRHVILPVRVPLALVEDAVRHAERVLSRMFIL